MMHPRFIFHFSLLIFHLLQVRLSFASNPFHIMGAEWDLHRLCYGLATDLLLIQSSSPQVLPRFMNNNARKEEQRQEVWDSHKGIEHVGKIPD